MRHSGVFVVDKIRLTKVPGEFWDQSRVAAVHNAKYSIANSLKNHFRYI